MARECEVEDCPRRTHGAEAYCESHRWRLRIHGDVKAHIPIGRMRHGVELGTVLPVDAETEAEIAYAPTPEPGRGLLWLV